MLSVFSDEYFMKEAYKEAIIAFEEGEVPVGAVVVCQNRIIAKAHNQTERLNDSTAHAEMIALTSAFNHLGGKYLPDCSLYVTLEPCVMCAGASFWAQIVKLVYGASDPKRGFDRLSENILHPKTKVIPGIMESECRYLIDDFFRRVREK
ncbi:nucleoside deaminase [Fulvivirgaceae bacterium BMA10]|uniref:tRNA-specific adenosine deaminase n=1 Tax=Splendidivirga corallicola TaxID=3051826 RepID=A0ABT8KLU6_9BACT|nr:nucleoside deaminase [Fulvivirgaceae bacterium BMA10]